MVNFSAVQYCWTSATIAVRVARRLSGFFASENTPDEYIVYFRNGNGAKLFEALVCGEGSGWAVNVAKSTTCFHWSLYDLMTSGDY